MVIFPLAPDQTIAQMWSNGAQGGRTTPDIADENHQYPAFVFLADCVPVPLIHTRQSATQRFNRRHVSTNHRVWDLAATGSLGPAERCVARTPCGRWVAVSRFVEVDRCDVPQDASTTSQTLCETVVHCPLSEHRCSLPAYTDRELYSSIMAMVLVFPLLLSLLYISLGLRYIFYCVASCVSVEIYLNDWLNNGGTTGLIA